jgi:hypothetical protein
MTISTGGLEAIFDTDKRHITALQWVDVSLLHRRLGSGDGAWVADMTGHSRHSSIWLYNIMDGRRFDENEVE